MSESMDDLRHRLVEQGWDAVRDPAALKLVKVADEERLFIQFAPEDTLVFPVEYLTDGQRARILEARPDLDIEIALALRWAQAQRRMV
jgi:hypothetical protein